VVPPVVTAVKVTSELVDGVVGRNVKPVERGGGVPKTVTMLKLVAVWDGEEESVTFSVTVNVCALVKV